MPEFKSWRCYWDFAQAVRQTARYVRDKPVEEFLGMVRETGLNRVKELPESELLWRAQLGNDLCRVEENGEDASDVPIPYSPERMKPRLDRATEGRANPKGIPYLYSATTRVVAIAEVRPWIGSLISVAEFKTTRALKVLDCTAQGRNTRAHFCEPSPEVRERCVWKDINYAFAKPVTPSDDVADYAPTQIIAELFRAANLDGIAYRSSLGEGNNMVLFDLSAVELMNRVLFEAKNIKFDFQQYGKAYFESKPSEEKALGGF